MTRHALKIKKAGLVLTTGILFGGLSCVSNVGDIIGTGLTLTGNPLGAGLDLFADLIRFGL